MSNEETTFSPEEGMKQLDEILSAMEDPQLNLEESFKKYKEGMELLKKCNDALDTVEGKILELNTDGELKEFQ